MSVGWSVPKVSRAYTHTAAKGRSAIVWLSVGNVAGRLVPSRVYIGVHTMAAILDCTKFSKTALKGMLESEAFKEHHATISAFLSPKPKDMTPVAGKVHWRAKASSMSTTLYPKGYVRMENNSGNGCLYLEAAVEMIDHLQSLVSGGQLKSYKG